VNEAHPAHVGRELKDDIGAADSAPAGIDFAQVADAILDFGGSLMPLVDRFQVDRADYIHAAGEKIFNKMTADEAARATNNDSLVFQFHERLLLMLRWKLAADISKTGMSKIINPSRREKARVSAKMIGWTHSSVHTMVEFKF
jgi:hypothetical protein